MIEEIKDDSEDTHPKLIPTEYDKKWGKTGTIGHIVQGEISCSISTDGAVGGSVKKRRRCITKRQG